MTELWNALLRLWHNVYADWVAWWEPHEVIVNIAFNTLLVTVIGYVLGLKGLNIARETKMGKAMSDNNLAFAVVYLGTSMALWVAFFASDPWRLFARTLILVTSVRVLLAMKEAYGGWRELHVRAILNARAIAAEFMVWALESRWRLLLAILAMIGLAVVAIIAAVAIVAIITGPAT